MIDLMAEYLRLSEIPGDMQEHLPTLRDYAQGSETIIECGMRGCVSTMALLLGLSENEKPTKRYIGCDTERTDFIDALPGEIDGVKIEFWHGNDLDLDFPPADLVLIDTWHVYGQLKRELAKFHPLAKRILLHDTTVDALLGETVRLQLDLEEQVRQTGWDVGEVVVGLWPAVTEFLLEHPEWELEARFENCYGLTVLHKAG